MTRHVAVWIDQKEARIFHLELERADKITVRAPLHSVHHKHPKDAEGAREHPDDAKRFFHEVARALEGAEAVLVAGPSTAKLDLMRYVHQHERALEQRVVGVETVDHPTDGQLIAYAKKYFERTDAIRPPSAS